MVSHINQGRTIVRVATRNESALEMEMRCNELQRISRSNTILPKLVVRKQTKHELVVAFDNDGAVGSCILSTLVDQLCVLHQHGIAHGSICSLRCNPNVPHGELPPFGINFLLGLRSYIEPAYQCQCPEMVVTVASDMWDIGILICELVSNETAPSVFENAKSFYGWVHALEAEVIQLKEIIRGCLHPNPLKRISAAKVKEVLQQPSLAWLLQKNIPPTKATPPHRLKQKEKHRANIYQINQVASKGSNEQNTLKRQTELFTFHILACITASDDAQVLEWLEDYDQAALKRYIDEAGSNDDFECRFSQVLRLCPQEKHSIHVFLMQNFGVLTPFRQKAWQSVLCCGPSDSQYERSKRLFQKQSRDGSLETKLDIRSFEDQLQRDIPRSHQYHPVLYSKYGKARLQQLLCAWSVATKKPYWQGLDSICAVFIAAFDNASTESIFPLFLRFFEKYFPMYFELDSLDDLRRKWSSLFLRVLYFTDSALASHIVSIGFLPEVFSVSWFLTLFSHTLPIEDSVVLWDTFLLAPIEFPLFVGVALLLHSRARLLSSDLNECVLYRGLTSVNIQACIKTARSVFEKTPAFVYEALDSIPTPQYSAKGFGVLSWPSCTAERAYEIFQQDGIFLDLRPQKVFDKDHITNSYNLTVPRTTSKKARDAFCDGLRRTVENHRHRHTNSIAVLIGPGETYEDMHDVTTATELYFACGLPRCCVLQAPFEKFNTGKRMHCVKSSFEER